MAAAAGSGPKLLEMLQGEPLRVASATPLAPEEIARRLQGTRRELSNRRKILLRNLPAESSSQVGAGGRHIPRAPSPRPRGESGGRDGGRLREGSPSWGVRGATGRGGIPTSRCAEGALLVPAEREPGGLGEGHMRAS